MATLKRGRGDGKISGVRAAADVHIALSVDADAFDAVAGAPSEERAGNELRAIGRDPRYEAIAVVIAAAAAAAVVGLRDAAGGGEVARAGRPGDHHGAIGSERQAVGFRELGFGSAEIGSP